MLWQTASNFQRQQFISTNGKWFWQTVSYLCKTASYLTNSK